MQIHSKNTTQERKAPLPHATEAAERPELHFPLMTLLNCFLDPVPGTGDYLFLRILQRNEKGLWTWGKRGDWLIIPLPFLPPGQRVSLFLLRESLYRYLFICAISRNMWDLQKKWARSLTKFRILQGGKIKEYVALRKWEDEKISPSWYNDCFAMQNLLISMQRQANET